MTDATDTPPGSETADLQFDRAEVDGPADATDTPIPGNAGGAAVVQCDTCSINLSQTYYAVDDTALCGNCKDEVVAVVEARTRPMQFIRAFGFGIPAAMLGSAIYYAILAITDYEIGLVSILIGFMVGAAVRAGSGPGGGRRYQLLAAGLTYCAIVTTYVPFVIEGLQEAAEEEMEMEALAAADVSDGDVSDADVSGEAVDAVSAAAATPEAPEEAPLTLSDVVVAFAAVFAIAFVAPVLGGFENILGILIIGFGVYQAWKMNKRLELEITGPHTVGSQPAESF